MPHPFRDADQTTYLLAILLKLCDSPAEAMEKLRVAKELLAPEKSELPANLRITTI